MLKKFTACLFSLMFLSAAILPCFAQTTADPQSEMPVTEHVTVEAVEEDTSVADSEQTSEAEIDDVSKTDVSSETIEVDEVPEGVSQEESDNTEVTEALETTDSEAVSSAEASVMEAQVDATENTDNISESEKTNQSVKPNVAVSSGVPTPAETAKAVEKADEEIATQKKEAKEKTFLDKLIDSFNKTFIKDSRWKLFLEGFGNTILIALCSTLLGVLIGMIIAIVKVLHSQIDRPNILINILNFFFNIYTTVIRGTPAVVQLFIAYYIIFSSSDNYIVVSIFAFGINSGAYVSEIVRGGILSIDRGQLEAGRSLGLSYIRTMVSIVLPQAIKNILPSLGNEFILLLKDTSIAGYIGTLDLMKAGNIVRSRTFEPYFSLLSVAAIYLVCVIGLEQLIKYFERRMAKSDRH